MRFLAVILLLSLIAGAAHGQETPKPGVPSVVEKPVGETGKAFTDHARKNWQRTDAIYLPKNVDLKFKASGERIKPSDFRPSADTTQVIATIILIGFVIAIIIALLNNRLGGGLFSSRQKDERLGDDEQPAKPQSLFEHDEETPLTLAQIMALDDPRVGLRALLVQALRRAALQNEIPLRRSLTARDVVRLIPGSWPLRDPLVRLVSTAEVVLFGGSEITRDQYASTVQAAAPLLDGKAGR